MNHRPNPTANGPPASDDSSTNISSPSTFAEPQPPSDGGAAEQPIVKDATKKEKNMNQKSLWVTIFKCFQCDKRGHKLPKCTQCSQAYYCNTDCQRKHWKKHKPVCRATVAALARRATRERLARAVRKKGKDKVEHSGDDELCVICQDTTVDAVEVGVLEVYNRCNR